MLERSDVASLARPLKHVRVPASDVSVAEAIVPPPHVKSEASRKFAVMGAAVLEKLCRSGGLDVVSRRTTPYLVSTPRGHVAISVMVSAISGDPATKNIIVPVTSLCRPRGSVDHVFVAAFVSKYERVRTRRGGVETCLAGWMTEDGLRAHAARSRVFSALRIITVPVARLYTMDTLRDYIMCTGEKEMVNEEVMHRMHDEAPRGSGCARD